MNGRTFFKKNCSFTVVPEDIEYFGLLKTNWRLTANDDFQTSPENCFIEF